MRLYEPVVPAIVLGQQVQRLRVAHLSAVTPADLRAIIGRLVKSARGGDVGASKLVLGYALGPPIAGDILEKLQNLEAIAGIRTDGEL